MISSVSSWIDAPCAETFIYSVRRGDKADEVEVKIKAELDNFDLAVLFADVEGAHCAEVSWFHGHDVFLQFRAECRDFAAFRCGDAEAVNPLFAIIIEFAEALSYVECNLPDLSRGSEKFQGSVIPGWVFQFFERFPLVSDLNILIVFVQPF